LVKAKNFLVFQGDVEAVASQSPIALTKLVEQISGSLELAAEYNEALKAQERATDNATFNYTKRRGINGEIKQFREQKSEALRFENLIAERVRWYIVPLNLFSINRFCRTRRYCTNHFGDCFISMKKLTVTTITSNHKQEPYLNQRTSSESTPPNCLALKSVRQQLEQK
jgi:hypothetical protein